MINTDVSISNKLISQTLNWDYEIYNPSIKPETNVDVDLYLDNECIDVALHKINIQRFGQYGLCPPLAIFYERYIMLITNVFFYFRDLLFFSFFLFRNILLPNTMMMMMMKHVLLTTRVIYLRGLSMLFSLIRNI